MSKQKAFKVFSSEFKSTLNGYTYACGRLTNPLKPIANKVVTGKWSYPWSYAQVVKKNHKIDGRTSITEVKGYESVLEANLCNSSGNRTIGVVNHKDAGSSTFESLGDQVTDNLVNSLTQVSSSCNKGIAMVTGRDNHDSESIVAYFFCLFVCLFGV